PLEKTIIVEAAGWHRPLMQAKGPLYSPDVLSLLSAGETVPAPDYAEFQYRRATWARVADGLRRCPARRRRQPDGAGAPRAADAVAERLRRTVLRTHEAVEPQRVPGPVGAGGAGRAGATGRLTAGRVAAGGG